MDVLSYHIDLSTGDQVFGRNPTSDGCALLYHSNQCHFRHFRRNPTSDGCALLFDFVTENFINLVAIPLLMDVLSY